MSTEKMPLSSWLQRIPGWLVAVLMVLLLSSWFAPGGQQIHQQQLDFWLAWLGCMLLLAWPMTLLELALARRSQNSPLAAFGPLTREADSKPVWRGIGYLAVAAMASLDWAGQWLGLGVLGLVFMLPAWWWMPAPAGAGATATAPAAGPSRRWMGFFVAAYFCAGFGYVISATFIIAIVGKLPLLANLGGWVWVLVGLMATPSCFVWDRLAARLGQIPALLLAYGLQTVSIALPAASEGALLNLLSAALYGGTFVGIVSLTLSIIGRHFPANPAKAMARMTLSYGVAQIVAPALAGYIATVTGSYRGALWLAAAVMLAGMAALAALREKPAHRP